MQMPSTSEKNLWAICITNSVEIFINNSCRYWRHTLKAELRRFREDQSSIGAILGNDRER